MGVAEDRPGFLGRWARRKNNALQGKPLDEPAAPVNNLPVPASPVSSVLATAKPEPETAPQESAPEKLLSLDDVKLLTQESDFRPFMAGNVGSDVRNAAMKKLFTDPHYNVMDGLDIYISDYSIADPIPESMLRQMVGAKLLKIFDDDDDDDDDDEDKDKDKDDKAIEGPGLADKQEAVAMGTPASETVDSDGDLQATSTPLVEKIPIHGAQFESVFDPASNLPVLPGTRQRDDVLTHAADSDLERAQIALLPRL